MRVKIYGIFWRFYAKRRVLNKIIMPGSVCFLSIRIFYLWKWWSHFNKSRYLKAYTNTSTVLQASHSKILQSFRKLKSWTVLCTKSVIVRKVQILLMSSTLCGTVLNILNISGNKEGKIIARAMSLVIDRAIIDSHEGQHICKCNKCI
jgi:hypothetical protein